MHDVRDHPPKEGGAVYSAKPYDEGVSSHAGAGDRRRTPPTLGWV